MTGIKLSAEQPPSGSGLSWRFASTSPMPGGGHPGLDDPGHDHGASGVYRRYMLLGIGALLTACGFQPVYMPTASGRAGPAQRELAAVNVNLIPDRPGQLLRQALQERFGSDAYGSVNRYDLAVGFSIAGEGIGVQADTTVSRIRLTGTASWTLIARDSGHTVLTRGSARAMDAFNILDQQYFAADLDTEAVQKRLAQALADQIALQLAVYFRRKAASSTG